MRIYNIISVIMLMACGLCLGIHFARAETNAPASAPVVAVAEVIRDPFWPVGYLPPSLIPEAEEEAAVEQAITEIQALDEARARAFAALKVGGIIRRGNRYFASVNAQMVCAGDVIVVPMSGHVFRFLIRNITMRKVQIEPLK